MILDDDEMPIKTITITGEFWTPDEKMPDEDTEIKIVTVDGRFIETTFRGGLIWLDYYSTIKIEEILLWTYEFTVNCG